MHAIFSRLLLLLGWLLVGATSGLCQETIWTDWKDILGFDQTKLQEEHPVVLEGVVLFFRKDQPFFVIEVREEIIPVYFQRSLPHLQSGEHVRITGSTMIASELPGVRLTLLEKISPSLPTGIGSKRRSFDLSADAYFTWAESEGLVTGVESLEEGYLLNFIHPTTESICLFLPSDQISLDQAEALIGCKVRTKGLFLPFSANIKEDSLLPTICLKRYEDLTILSDLLNQRSVMASSATQIVESGESPIVIEGKLELKDGFWFVNQNGLRLRIDWQGDALLEGANVLCLGYPAKAIDQVLINHSVIFQSNHSDESTNQEGNSLRRSNFTWKRSIKPQSIVLRSVQEIRDAGFDVDDPTVVVDLQAVVTYHDPLWELFFVEDEYGGIYVVPRDKALRRIPAGSVVRLRGVKQRGETSNMIIMADVEFIRAGEKVTPVRSSIGQLNTGSMDSNYVVIEARIQRARKIDHALELKLFTEEGSTKAYIRGYSEPGPYDHLIDSNVELTGTCGFDFGSNNEILGTVIYVNDLDQMKIIQPGNTSFDQEPIERLSQQQLSASGEMVASRVRLKGTYIGKRDQSAFYFQTESQGFIVEPVQKEASLEFGKDLEVLGWPRLNGDTFEIIDALLRVPDSNPALGKRIQPIVELDIGHLNRFVQRTGTLTQIEREDGRITFHIDSSRQHLTASLDLVEEKWNPNYEIPIGSEVEVSGILVTVPGKNSVGEIPAIKLHSLDSIKQLAPPSFLTVQRVLWLFVIVGAIGLVSLLWGLTLKKQVRQQTAKIRKTIEMERQTKERFQRLFESALDMIFLCDTSARIIAMNQAGLQLIGTEFSEIKGQSILKWVVPSDRSKAEEALGLGSKAGRQLASEGEVIELQLKTIDNHIVFVELSISGFHLDQGGFGYQCIARNIDARKQSETHLIKARDAYRDANQAKSIFLAMMSHELRTPMNGVIGMTQLLLNTSLTCEQKDQAQTILDSSRGMMRLVLDLLDISKIESGKLVLSEESFDLVLLVEEVLATLSVEADRKKLDLTLLFQPRMNRQYRGDATRLRQVLLNLVGNGIKFTERGGVAVKVMEGVTLNGGEQIRIEVEDTGIGIGDAEKKDLFEAFVQLDSSETRKFGGAGLGLSICKRIVQAMGGVIGVEGHSHRGSSFWVEIPMRVMNKRSVVRIPPLDIPETSAGVLLVTNNALVRDYFNKHLTQADQQLATESSTDFLRRISSPECAHELLKFHAFIVDVTHTERGFLKSMSEFIDANLVHQAPWVFIEPVSGQSDEVQLLNHFSHKLKVLKPLTETTFQQVCRFLQNAKSDNGIAGEQVDKNEELEASRDPKSIVAEAGLKVLVAEDDPINQKLISLYLKKVGCHAVLVHDGKKVLQQLKENPFDVILMDCSMPVMDGFEATRLIRKNPKFQNIPIIALTAHSLKGDRERCFDAGMDDYLPKPLNLDLLTEKLSRLVDPKV